MTIVMSRQKPILQKVTDLLAEKPNLQQFGQVDDDWVWDGRTACTHTCVQSLAWVWLRRLFTLNQINSMAGMPHNPTRNGVPRGMNNVELGHVISALHLPYVIRFGLTYEQLLSYSNRGPVFYGMRYGSAPTKKGFVYQGVTAKAPFARVNGRTQLTGFNNGRHAVLLLGYRSLVDTATGKVVEYVEWRKEPNHGSGSRPEKPPFDQITTTQGKREYLDYHDLLGNTLYAAVPTRSLTV